MRDIAYLSQYAALRCHPARACATRVDSPTYSSQPDACIGLRRLQSPVGTFVSTTAFCCTNAKKVSETARDTWGRSPW